MTLLLCNSAAWSCDTSLVRLLEGTSELLFVEGEHGRAVCRSYLTWFVRAYITCKKKIQSLSHTIVLLYVAKNNVICNARGKQME